MHEPRDDGAILHAPYINAVDIDIVPGPIDNFLAALKENGAASVHEPGCRAFNIAVSQKDANHVFVFEVYAEIRCKGREDVAQGRVFHAIHRMSVVCSR